MSLLSPAIAIRQHKNSMVDMAEMFKNVCSDIDDTWAEWKLLYCLQINVSTFNEYWVEVNKEQNAGGKESFKHIWELALSLFSSLFSNASVERAFSIFNIMKDKLRNRTSSKTADAILCVRYLLSGKRWIEHNPTAKMLKAFKSEIFYESEFHDKVLHIFKKVGQAFSRFWLTVAKNC